MQAEVKKTAVGLPPHLRRVHCSAFLWRGASLTFEFVAENLGLFEVLCEKPAIFWRQITEIRSPERGWRWTVDRSYGDESVKTEFEYPDKIRLGFAVEEEMVRGEKFVKNEDLVLCSVFLR